jgi:hypothetical protein
MALPSRGAQLSGLIPRFRSGTGSSAEPAHLKEFQVMKGHPWQTCHYYPGECCPNRTLIDRVYLIPHLLAPSELASIESKCAVCEVCRGNRRKERRVPRHLTVAILDERSGQKVQGSTLNVSDRGALIQVGDRTGFRVNQEVHLWLCDETGWCTSTRAVITRLESARSALSVRLLSEL